MNELLKVNSLCFSYGSQKALKNISFGINAGEMLCVVGENGSGKSTLLKTITGALGNYSGEILYCGKNLRSIRPLEKARQIAVLYQNGVQHFPFTCFEVVAMGLYPHKGCLNALTAEDTDFICGIMQETNTLDFSQRPINNLSGGQIQRVLLAKALAQKPRLLLLDEAMSGLDISSAIKMTDVILKRCAKDGMAVINITHNINSAFDNSHRILALKNGGVYAFDKPKALLNKEFFREVFDLEVEIDIDKKYFRIMI